MSSVTLTRYPVSTLTAAPAVPALSRCGTKHDLMMASPRILAYKQIVADYLSQVDLGWSNRDDPLERIREIEDAATTILRFGGPGEREEFYELLDDSSVARMVYGKILTDDRAPQKIRDKAVALAKRDFDAGEFI